MITEQYISFETAKLAREKGFNEPCLYYYIQNELYQVPLGTYRKLQPLKNSELNPYTEAVSAPTQSLLARWVRKEHNIYIDPCLMPYELRKYSEDYKDFLGFKILSGWEYRLFDCKDSRELRRNSDKALSTYEEALEMGLQEILGKL